MAGQSLLIPSQALNANSSETLKPYEPGKATGSLDPTLPMPANKDKCGGMGKIIMAVVAVAVAVWAPQFLGQLGYTGLTTGAAGTGSVTGLGGAIGGAAGSIASQAVGVAIGAQDKFSWKGVALSALAGGITGGLNANTQLFNLTSSPAVNTALRMATANALTQGIGVATGLQKKFDWKGVAASAAGGFAGAAVNARLPEGLDPFLGRVVSGFAAGTAAAVARGGRVAIQQVAVDAFGNAIGGAIAENMQPRQSMYSLGGTSRSSIGLQAPAEWSSSLGRSSDNATYGQFVEAFSNPARFEGGDGIQLAAGPGYSGMGMGGTDRLQVNRDISVFEEASALAASASRSNWRAAQAQATSDLYANGLADIRDTSPAAVLLGASNITGPSINGISATTGTGSYQDPRNNAEIMVRSTDTDGVPDWQINNMGSGLRVSGEASMTAMSEAQGFLAFNPTGRAIKGIAGVTIEALAIVPNAGRALGTLAGDAYGCAASAIAPQRSVLTGQPFAYQSKSALLQSIQQQGVLGTLGAGVTGAVRNAPGIGLIGALGAPNRDWGNVGAQAFNTGAILGGAVGGLRGGSVANSAGDISQAAIRSRVTGNLAESTAARSTSNFEAHVARSDQVRWGYAADEWGMTGLKAGDRVIGGLPGQSSYYTTAGTLEASGGSRASLFQSLQVKADPEFGYRPKVGEYEVLDNLTVPFGTVKANPGLGVGGGDQFFISNYQNSLRLIREIPLGQ